MPQDSSQADKNVDSWQQGEELRFSLLCDGHIIRLEPGTFTMGRSSSCEIVVDDLLASREHARLYVSHTQIELEDLDSTNGVYVNGERIDGRVMLHAGDVIVIGTQNLQLGALPTDPDETKPSFFSTLADLDDPGFDMVEGTENSPSSPPSVRPSGVPPAPDEHVGTQRADTFQSFAPTIERMLLEGRTDIVERLMEGQLNSLLEGAREGKTVPGGTLELVSDLLVKVVEATLAPSWLDGLLELHLLARRPLPGPVLVQLSPLLPAVRGTDADLVADYLAMLEQLQSSLPLSDRVLCERTRQLLRG